MAFTFYGGIHLNEHKTTRGCAVEKMPAPKTVSLPLSQHIGVPATPIVKVGDTVDKGQVIAEVTSGLGCPVHASISGKVTAIIDKDAPNGKRITNIVIENDGEDRLSPDLKGWEKSLTETSTEEIIEIIRKAGISGMGGATFPTYMKIKSGEGKVNRVIINCAECEPFITANHRLLLERPEDVINGLKILLKAFSLREGEIAVEDNKGDAIQKLEKIVGNSRLIRIRTLRTKYPQGDERQLIFALTGKELPTGKLPADLGCLVMNAETCAAVFAAFSTGMPLIERIVTVDGDCVRNPKNLLVPLGTSYRDVFDYCGGFKKEPKKIVNGGPMMGVAQWDLSSGVSKGTSALLAFSEKMENPFEQPPTCIRCGRCVAACPMHLMPNYLAAYSKKGDLAMAEQLDVLSCVECGSCSYSCPGHMPIVQYIRAAKGQILDHRRANQAALERSRSEKAEGAKEGGK